VTSLGAQQPRPRARDLGIIVGSIPTGPLDAITDVAGVRVGHTTIARGDSINSAVTAILPHGGNPFREKVPAAIVVGNGFGKLAGSTQVNELGELESPIVLTCTLCVPRPRTPCSPGSSRCQATKMSAPRIRSSARRMTAF